MLTRRAPREVQAAHPKVESRRDTPPAKIPSKRRAKDYADQLPKSSHINCFSGDTPVITSTGTSRISDLTGDIHRLLTGDGKWHEASVQSFGCQPLWRIRLSRSGIAKTIYAAEYNRWSLRTCTSTGNRYWGKPPSKAITTNLRSGYRLTWGFPTAQADRFVDLGGIARGFVFGDGTRSKSSSIACFCGDKDKALLSYFAGLGNLPRTYGNVTKISGLPRDWKTSMPSCDEPASYLYGWLAGYFAADGDVDKTGRPTLSSASRKTLEYVRVICNRSGIGTYGIREHVRSGFGRPPTPIYLLGLMRGDLNAEFFLIPTHRERFEHGCNAVERRGWTVVSADPAEQVAEVYGVVVKGAHSFTLEDHILTPT